MSFLCKLGVHLIHISGTEEGRNEHANEFRLYESCDCGKKKKYRYSGRWVTDNDLLGYGSE